MSHPQTPRQARNDLVGLAVLFCISLLCFSLGYQINNIKPSCDASVSPTPALDRLIKLANENAASSVVVPSIQQARP